MASVLSFVTPIISSPAGLRQISRTKIFFPSRARQLTICKSNTSPENDKIPKELEVLWDDGYRKKTIQDYLHVSRETVTNTDGGPARWFCPLECGHPIKDSPVLLFLPGMDGTGWGLILHHQSLGKVFEVRCLHIPANDRTPLEGLLEIIETAVRLENAAFPKRPIYLVGDNLGGCLALSIAARNPSIDLILVLSNPATSFRRSPLQFLLPIVEALHDSLYGTFTCLLGMIMGNPIKMLTANISNDELLPVQTFKQMFRNLGALLPRISSLEDIIPKETLLWKLKLLKSASDLANNNINEIKAEVLVLASGKENLLPSRDEAQRLYGLLKNCKVRHFKNNGHTLLLEDGLNMLTFIKSTRMYRRLNRRDDILDFIPISKSEYNQYYLKWYSTLITATSPVMLSTLQDGQIVRGLEGIPDEGPVLLVGYHTLMALEVASFAEFIKEKKVTLRGIAHPLVFSDNNETSLNEFSNFDYQIISGAIPVSPTNLYKLFSKNSFVLLFPGGAREALHRKGEEYKCFWPEQPEFVRMAAKFGAKIIPFAVVGEDDLFHYVLDYDDQMKIPFLRDSIIQTNKEIENIRVDAKGEVSDQKMFTPGILPKIPGRFYYLFGKCIETKGMEEQLKDKDMANEMYMHIKSEVENIMSYLVKKREDDPYRGIIQRTIYKATKPPNAQVPTFELEDLTEESSK